MSRRRALIGAGGAAAALLVIGGILRGPQGPSASPSPTLTVSHSPLASAASSPPAAGQPFQLGVEYALPGLGELYGAIGLTAAKPALEYGVWGNVEPSPGQFAWGPLDALVAEYQAAGMTDLQLLLSAESPWASRRPPSGLDKGDTFPKDEYVDDYVAFVSAVVERYDGDGVDDAPGLVAGIHEWGIEREFSGFWPGTADDYVRLLHLAAPAIRAADPQARILLVAILGIDVFNGGPDPATVAQRWETDRSYRKSLADTETILAACDAYDVVDFHSLGGEAEIPATMAWLRATGERLGCVRPITIGDAFSWSALLAYGDPFGISPPLALFPATDETRDAVIATLQAVADRDPVATDWLRAWLSRGLVRKVVTAAGEGAIGINVGNQEDWEFSVRAFGTANFMGITDSLRTLTDAGGTRLPYQGAAFNKVHDPGALRPAFGALALVNRELSGVVGGARVDAGTEAVVYRLDRADGSELWVAWVADDRVRLPGDAVRSATLHLPFDAPSARVTSTPVTDADLDPPSDTVAAANGVLELTVGATPVFIEVGE